MKLVCISGSPRNGNTEWMLKNLLKLAVSSRLEAELVLLRKLDIRTCNGCLTCDKGGRNRTGVCSIRDDMQSIYPRLLAADLIVMGTPVYFEMISGLLKNFLDRTCPIWPHLEGKRLAGIAVAEEGVGSAIANLQTYAAVCGMKWSGSVTALARNPRQVARNEVIPGELERLLADLLLDAF